MLYIHMKNILLEDDDTPTGGTSYQNETLNDFICELELHNKSLTEINKELKLNGIKEITPDQIKIVGEF